MSRRRGRRGAEKDRHRPYLIESFRRLVIRAHSEVGCADVPGAREIRAQLRSISRESFTTEQLAQVVARVDTFERKDGWRSAHANGRIFADPPRDPSWSDLLRSGGERV